ncbi:hypothetical protein K469DRAFT_761143 [Zopfia rhizophila CBS 207.26]|uniref:Uncharacterized protein n=1 Tax=Zopfia rhizophila CBS 207.26 TaxID=1314779 RepID=A0A6A6DCY2_9PEZI|nr:hypothetical protein K469DRAFT_761143 [Zopfia rhizophila CBS 207.26]
MTPTTRLKSNPECKSDYMGAKKPGRGHSKEGDDPEKSSGGIVKQKATSKREVPDTELAQASPAAARIRPLFSVQAGPFLSAAAGGCRAKKVSCPYCEYELCLKLQPPMRMRSPRRPLRRWERSLALTVESRLRKTVVAIMCTVGSAIIIGVGSVKLMQHRAGCQYLKPIVQGPADYYNVPLGALAAVLHGGRNGAAEAQGRIIKGVSSKSSKAQPIINQTTMRLSRSSTRGVRASEFPRDPSAEAPSPKFQPPQANSPQSRSSEAPSPEARSSHAPIKVKDMIPVDTSNDDGIKIPSPIPSFPKPLALSYRNFNQYYQIHKTVDKTRMEVGSALISSMIQHFFPSPAFKARRLSSQKQGLFETIPAEGTVFWTISGKQDDASNRRVRRSDQEVGSSAFSLENSATTLVDEKSESKVDVLFAVVTGREFLDRSERKGSGRRKSFKIKFSSAFSSNRGVLLLEEKVFRSGYVVFLGGRTKPTMPTLEFYTYDVDGEDGLTFVPYFGHSDFRPDGFESNSFSLESEEAEKVNQIFKTIASSERANASRQRDYPLKRPKESINPSGLFRLFEIESSRWGNASKEMNDAYRMITDSENASITGEHLKSIRIDSAGRLVTSDGHFLTKDKAAEAKRLTKARRIKFAVPQPKASGKDTVEKKL